MTSKFRTARLALHALLIGAALTTSLTALAAAQEAVTMTASDDVAALPGVAFNQALADKLPATIKEAGVMKVATDLTPPISFHDENGDLVGIDADLAAAMGVILGLKIEMTDVGAGTLDHVQAF